MSPELIRLMEMPGGYSQVGSNSRVLLKVFIVFFKLKFLRKQLFYFLPIQVLLIRLFK